MDCVSNNDYIRPNRSQFLPTLRNYTPQNNALVLQYLFVLEILFLVELLERFYIIELGIGIGLEYLSWFLWFILATDDVRLLWFELAVGDLRQLRFKLAGNSTRSPQLVSIYYARFLFFILRVHCLIVLLIGFINICKLTVNERIITIRRIFDFLMVIERVMI